jgi:hypothetical protein
MRRLLSTLLIAFLLFPGLAVDSVSLVCRASDAGVMAVDQCCCTTPNQQTDCAPSQMQRSCCCDVQRAYHLVERLPATALTKFSLPDLSSDVMSKAPIIAVSSMLLLVSSSVFPSPGYPDRLPSHPLRTLLCTYRI